MTEQLTMAAKNLKNLGTEITQWENRLEFVKSEAQKATSARDAINAEIERKSNDYSIYVTQRDLELKKRNADIQASVEQLQKDKEEFQGILNQHRQNQLALDAEKLEFESRKSKHDGQVQNVQEFITAVRRASGLLGI
jgi:chromosome segregation ATPase